MCSQQVGSGEGQGEADGQRSASRAPSAPGHPPTRPHGQTDRQASQPTGKLPLRLPPPFPPSDTVAVGGPLYSSSAKWTEKPQGATRHTTHTRSEQGPSRTPSPISRVSFPVSSGGESSLTSSTPSSAVFWLHSYLRSLRRGC